MKSIHAHMRMLSGLPWWMYLYEYARAVRIRLVTVKRDVTTRRGR